MTAIGTDAAFEEIEQRIAELQDRLDSCRQAIALSRVAIYGGAAALVLILIAGGAYRTPIAIIALLTAVLGGTIWSGASASSRDDLHQQLAVAQATQARLFDDIAARNDWPSMTTVH